MTDLNDSGSAVAVAVENFAPNGIDGSERSGAFRPGFADNSPQVRELERAGISYAIDELVGERAGATIEHAADRVLQPLSKSEVQDALSDLCFRLNVGVNAVVRDDPRFHDLYLAYGANKSLSILEAKAPGSIEMAEWVVASGREAEVRNALEQWPSEKWRELNVRTNVGVLRLGREVVEQGETAFLKDQYPDLHEAGRVGAPSVDDADEDDAAGSSHLLAKAVGLAALGVVLTSCQDQVVVDTYEPADAHSVLLQKVGSTRQICDPSGFVVELKENMHGVGKSREAVVDVTKVSRNEKCAVDFGAPDNRRLNGPNQYDVYSYCSGNDAAGNAIRRFKPAAGDFQGHNGREKTVRDDFCKGVLPPQSETNIKRIVLPPLKVFGIIVAGAVGRAIATVAFSEYRKSRSSDWR